VTSTDPIDISFPPIRQTPVDPVLENGRLPFVDNNRAQRGNICGIAECSAPRAMKPVYDDADAPAAAAV
jgi:hypothetical protein